MPTDNVPARSGPTASEEARLLGRIRLLLVLFAAGLVISGLTAIPLCWEVGLLARVMGAADSDTVDNTTGILRWVVMVRNGLDDGYGRYPFLAYGTDWLAFGHVVIALAFIGPWRDPVRNAWVIDWGMLACVLVVPMALCFGPARGIPFFHQIVDCCFGVFGIIPLWICRRDAARLEALRSR